MDLSNLYNMAFDMVIQNKSNGVNFSLNDNSTVTIISTKSGDIFKATSGKETVNGKVINTSSEREAILCMVKESQVKVDTIVTLKVENGDFVIPPRDCIDLILQMDSENIGCNVMTNVNDSIKLETLIGQKTDTPTEDVYSLDDWSEGWDVPNDETPTESNTNTIVGSNPIPDNTVSVKKDTTPSRYYQSMYTNNTPTPVDSSISVSPIDSKNPKRFKPSGSISDFIKKISSSDTETFKGEKRQPSKKELVKLAKEKKKMAKKDAKILDANGRKK